MNISKKYTELTICRVCLKEPVSFNLYEDQNKSILLKLRTFIQIEVSFFFIQDFFL